MPTRAQVRALVEQGLDYAAIGQRLGVPAGQAYMIGTGIPADGGDTVTEAERRRPGVLPTAQHLIGVAAENPTSGDSVLEWIRARTAADPQMQDAARRRTLEPPPVADDSGDHDVLAVLTRDHNQVKHLQEQLTALPGDRAHQQQRTSAVDLIAQRLAQHDALEERYFWPAVRQALPDGDRWADEAREQARQGEDTLSALGRLDPGSEEFDQTLQELSLLLRKHAAHQERLFLQLDDVLSDEHRRRLGEQVLAAKEEPTR